MYGKCVASKKIQKMTNMRREDERGAVIGGRKHALGGDRFKDGAVCSHIRMIP